VDRIDDPGAPTATGRSEVTLLLAEDAVVGEGLRRRRAQRALDAEIDLGDRRAVRLQLHGEPAPERGRGDARSGVGELQGEREVVVVHGSDGVRPGSPAAI